MFVKEYRWFLGEAIVESINLLCNSKPSEIGYLFCTILVGYLGHGIFQLVAVFFMFFKPVFWLRKACLLLL